MRRRAGLAILGALLGLVQAANGGPAEDAPVAAQFLDASRAYSEGDFDTSYLLYLALAEQGDVRAQVQLGVQYNYGQGVRQNFTEAIYWYGKAAEQRSSVADYRIAWLHFRGQGVIRSFINGAEWMQKAADLGNVDAMVFIGECFANGCTDESDAPVIPQDSEKARHWLFLPAAMGRRDAQQLLDQLNR